MSHREENNGRSHSGRPAALEVVAGEENFSRWKTFKESWEDYCLLEGIYSKEPARQVASFRVAFGEANRELLWNLNLGPILANDAAKTSGTEPCRTLEEILKTLDTRFAKHENVIHRRYIFHKATQAAGETVSDFFDRIMKLVRSCRYEAQLADVEVRDQLVLGTSLVEARASIFKETTELCLQDVLSRLRLYEDNHRALGEINNRQSMENVNLVKNRKPSAQHKESREPKNECRFCGARHAPRRCPAFGHRCKKCNRKNHLEKVCRSTEQAHQLRDTEDTPDSSEEEYAWMAENENSKTKKRFFVKLDTAGNRQLLTQVDTGATCNCMSQKTFLKWRNLGAASELRTDKRTRVKMYDNSITTAMGSCTVFCRFAKKNLELPFVVFNGQYETLLSGEWAERIGAVTFHKQIERAYRVSQQTESGYEDLVEEFSDIFHGLGKFAQEVKLELDPTIPPRQQPPRKTPIAIRKALIAKIRQLENDKIIEQVKKPTPWISNLVAVPKSDGSLRITLDPVDLNKAIIRPRYPMPTLDEHLPLLAKAKVFSIVDAKDGFYQMPLHPDSTDLTSFWTPIGRFKYLRTPQGISSAPEEYQLRQVQAYEGLRNVLVVADDAIVFGVGDTEKEARLDHDRNLRALFQRAREIGLRLNKKKLQLGKKSVRYMGHIVSNEGVKADPEKIKAIVEMETPSDSRAVQRFLGMANYMLSFLPNLADVTLPLREVIKKSNRFVWMESQQEAFDLVKKKLAEAPTLAIYDPEKEVAIYTDASDRGIGAVMLQEGKAVAYHSHALSPTEQGYATLEKECLAIVSACAKFDHLLFGKANIQVFSDHKPLSRIFEKPLEACPRRLQRMRLALQRYDIRVGYIAGNKNVVADALSRAPLQPAAPTPEDRETVLRLELESTKNEGAGRVSDRTLERIRAAMKSDVLAGKLLKAVRMGDWSDAELSVFKPFRNELVQEDGLVYNNQACFIPRSLRSDFLKRLHRSHLALSAMLRRVRGALFWPGMGNDVKVMTENCQACQSYSTKQSHEPLVPGEIPRYPFEIVHQDLFEWGGQAYLVTVDGYSDFFDVTKLGTTSTTSKIISVCKRLFSCFGQPKQMRTDSDPRYLSHEFKTFCSEWDIQHDVSEPHHHQANGKAESAVKIAKRLLKKSETAGEDFELALLEWRNTPQIDGPSPAEKLHSRRTRTGLPTRPQNLLQKTPRRVENLIRARRKQAKIYYDRGTRSLPPLKIGDAVRIEPEGGQKSWQRGKVSKIIGDRRYIVASEAGAILERNRRFLRRTPATPDSRLEDQQTTAKRSGPTWSGPRGPMLDHMWVRTDNYIRQQTSASTSSETRSSRETNVGQEDDTIAQKTNNLRGPARLPHKRPRSEALIRTPIPRKMPRIAGKRVTRMGRTIKSPNRYGDE